MTDKQARQAIAVAAKSATQGDWRYGRSGFNSIVQAPVVLPRGGSSNVVICKLFRSEWRGELKTAQDAAFIAAANPAAVLELLADLDAAEKRIAELEARKVAVTLPKPMQVSTSSGDVIHAWPSYSALVALEAAGITTRIEE